MDAVAHGVGRLGGDDRRDLALQILAAADLRYAA